MDAHVILNPTAGPLTTRADLQRALDLLGESGWRLTVQESSGPGDITRLARQAAANQVETLIVAGGDGTLSEAANGLAGSETALGLLPMGTGNIWAAQVGLVQAPTLLYRPDMLQAARALTESRRQRIDLGHARTLRGEHYFMLWAGVGLDAAIQRVVEDEGRPVKRRFGQLAYVWAAARPILEYRGTRAKLTLDGRRERGRIVTVIICNIQMYAGFELAPMAQMDDGWLDVAVFEGLSWADNLRHIGQIAFGRHLTDPQVTFYRAREVSLHTDPLLPAHYDGESLGITPLMVRVAPQALTVLLPPSTPPHLLSSNPWT
jgi:diacylglycerol kinase (ATP)